MLDMNFSNTWKHRVRGWMDQIIRIHQVRQTRPDQARPDSHLHLVDFLLQLRADPLRATHGRLQVPPLPPLPGDGYRHQDGVDGDGGSRSEESNAGQGGDEESQGVGHGSLSLS